MDQKVVITGGTGFLGKYLHEKFAADGFRVIIISRSSGVAWNDKNALIEALNGASLLINLAGKSVNCRYNDRNKKLIMMSRIQTTRLLGEAISECASPPAVWMNASSATIYRDEYSRPNTEADSITGNGFSIDVSKAWESTFFSFSSTATRMVALRITIVLGKDGGVIPIYKNLVRFGLGGRQGNGQQMFSWIHIEDMYRLIHFILANKSITGPVNCASPVAVTNEMFMSTFRAVMNVSFGLPGPKWLLSMGTVLIGTEPELIFKSRWVVPDKLLHAGFDFRYNEINEALKDLNR